MIINAHNLEIAAHCSKDTIKGFNTSVLRITNKASTATNNAYAVSVSTLGGSESDPIYLDPKDALKLKSNVEKEALELIPLLEAARVRTITTNKFPNIDRLFNDKEPAFEIRLDCNYLLTLAKSLASFGGNAVRIQFFSSKEPVRMDARNIVTEQRWEALLMPRVGNDPQFAEPELSEFDKALAEAQKLAGA